MPSRSVRRRRHKQLAHLRDLSAKRRSREAARWLARWRVEATQRAQHLDAPAVWGLTTDPQIQAIIQTLDPSGELCHDLHRVCAEAVARFMGDPRMARSCRPLAEPARRPARSRAPGCHVPDDRGPR